MTGHVHDVGGEAIAVPVLISAGGVDVDLSKIVSPQLREAIKESLEGLRAELIKQEIKRWITPQIAHEVLSVYGDERATAPSLARGALITLIRTCHISDDAMLAELNDVEEFHGYVLAICMLAESKTGDDSGLGILRGIAELLNEDDLREMEAME